MGRSKGKKFAAQPHIRMAKTAICEEGNTAGEFIDNMPYLERFRWSIFVAGRRISAAIDEWIAALISFYNLPTPAKLRA